MSIRKRTTDLANAVGLRPKPNVAPSSEGQVMLPVELDRPLPQLYQPQTATNPAAAPAAARAYLGDVDAHNKSIVDSAQGQNARASRQRVTNRRPDQPSIQSAYRGAQPGGGFADRPLKGTKGPPRHGR